MQLSKKKQKEAIWLQNGQRNKIDMYPKKTYKRPTGIWNNDHRHINRKYNEILLHTYKLLLSKRWVITSIDKVGEKETLVHYGEYKLVQPLQKEYGGSSKN